jgi:hypothetical protein
MNNIIIKSLKNGFNVNTKPLPTVAYLIDISSIIESNTYDINNILVEAYFLNVEAAALIKLLNIFFNLPFIISSLQ